jgi:GNAT superfamily N-acetyltransferase
VTTGLKGFHTIRRATLADATEIARLTGDLGYPAEANVIARRLETLLVRPDHFVVVAAARENETKLLGWIAAEARAILVAAPRVEIMGLVVDRAARRSGVGKRLVAAAEDWAAERGVRDVVVRSNILRAESHRFYEGVGYRREKSQHVYLKKL